jgi:hypothetical protein
MDIDIKVIGGIFSLLATIIGIPLYFYKQNLSRLKESKFRNKQIGVLSQTRYEDLYRLKLDSLIESVEHFYHHSLLENYSKHITISLFYSFFAFVFIYLINGVNSIGELKDILPKHDAYFDRGIVAATLLGWVTLLYLYLHYTPKMMATLSRAIPHPLREHPLIHILIIYIVGVVGGVVGVVGGVGVGGVGGGGGVVGVVVGVVVGGGVVGVVGGVGVDHFFHHYGRIKRLLLVLLILSLIWFTFFIAISTREEAFTRSFIWVLLSLPMIMLYKPYGFGVGWVVSMVGVLIYFYFINGQTLSTEGKTLLLFFITLPLFNALLDLISVRVSLYMARLIREDHSFIMALVHFLFDLLIAIVLLGVLYGILDYLLSNHGKEINPLGSILTQPLSEENGWIAFMLLSTIIPTFVHFVVVVGAFIAELLPRQKALQDILAYHEGEDAMLERPARYLTTIDLSKWIVALILVGLIGLVIYEIIRFFSPN